MDVMVWVLGIVFLTLVIGLAAWLFRRSEANRKVLIGIPRGRRVLFAVIACLLSFASAYGAMVAASTIANWNNPSILGSLGVLCCMLGFVGLQVVSMLCLVSVAIGSETPDDSKRS